MIVVDTNVWSELTKLMPFDGVRNWEASNSHLLWMPAVVLAEFRAGSTLMPPGRNANQLAAIIDTIVGNYSDRILPFDERCAQEYGPVLLSARQAGKPIQAADAMIAATARAHGMAVATRDLNDFAGAGVALIDPWQG